MPDEPWWRSAVIYQIYPRSFFDTAPSSWADGGRSLTEACPDASPAVGDGIGDLEGIRQRLDHLVDLGVDALWLSPFFRSPMADFGYDVADYCDVDPRFGTLADFDRLLADAHERGLRIMVDWVPNHSSDQHPWFLDARSSRRASHRDWYVWRDPSDPAAVARGEPPGPPPNNWLATFNRTAPAWTWDHTTSQWYLHLFLPEQPDLNWANPDVVSAMHDTLRFWLDRGVDGFRIDVTHCLGKDPSLADDPPELVAAGVPHSATNDDPRTHPILRDLRRLIDSYPGDRVIVGEVYLLSTAKVATYYGSGDELHLSFNFPPLYAPWEASAWRHRIDRTIAEIDARGSWPTWVLSNHDNPRHRTRYGDREDRARAAAILLLGLRGTPFLYAGEEFGLTDASIPPDRVVDPGGRDGCRAPLPWDSGPAHGWPTANPWLPWPPSADERNARVEDGDPSSVLGLYRRLLAARRSSPALHSGGFAWLESPDQVLAWTRLAQPDERIVIVNFGDAPAPVAVNGSWLVGVASDGPTGEGQPYGGQVGPAQAVILHPR